MTRKQIKPGPYIVPMPIVLVGANVSGKPNFMPAAFVSIVNFKPPIIACGLSPSHHTCDGIVAEKAFSLCIPSPHMVNVTDWCGLNTGKKVDKSQVFETFTGELGVPMIEDCRLNCECRLVDTREFKIDTVYMGEIVAVHADEDVLEDGEVSWSKIDPLLFTFPDKSYWKLGEHVAAAWSCGKDLEP